MWERPKRRDFHMAARSRDTEVPPTLWFNQRRRLVFGDAGVDSVAEFAVPCAVKEINHQSDDKPDKKADPGQDRQAQHQCNAENDAKNWKDRNKRYPKGPGPLRCGAAQHIHSKTNKDEGKERSDVC